MRGNNFSAVFLFTTILQYYREKWHLTAVTKMNSIKIYYRNGLEFVALQLQYVLSIVICLFSLVIVFC